MSEPADILNWLPPEDHKQLLKDAKDKNITVTRLLIKILDHWLRHNKTCEFLVNNLSQMQDYIARVCNMAFYNEEDLEFLIVEAIDRGLTQLLLKSRNHLPIALPSEP